MKTKRDDRIAGALVLLGWLLMLGGIGPDEVVLSTKEFIAGCLISLGGIVTMAIGVSFLE